MGNSARGRSEKSRMGSFGTGVTFSAQGRYFCPEALAEGGILQLKAGNSLLLQHRLENNIHTNIRAPLLNLAHTGATTTATDLTKCTYDLEKRLLFPD